MSRHSVVEAKNSLSDLIARAERGEEVVITRHGRAVVELRPVSSGTPASKRVTQASLDWLAQIRVSLPAGAPGAVEILKQSRDERDEGLLGR